jgi:hypothetical protein
VRRGAGPLSLAVYDQKHLHFRDMRHPIRGISGAKPRVLPSIRQLLAQEEAEKRKGASTQHLRKKRKGGGRKSAKPG